MGRHHAELDRQLMRVVRGEIDRLMVQMPPRHGKSELTSKYFPAWYHSVFPRRDIIMSSAVHNLAKQFSGESRDLLEEHGRLLRSGLTIRDDHRASDDWHTTLGGRTRAVGTGGAVFGRGAHLFLIDDFHGSMEDALSTIERDKVHRWFHTTAQNRLMPGGAIVIVATPYHPDDLMGRLLREEREGGEKWTVVKLPAVAGDNDLLGRKPGEELWPPVTIHGNKYGYSRSDLDRIRDNFYRSGYGWVWETMYQLDPPATINAEFDPSYFTGDDIWFDNYPADEHIAWRLVTLDPSIGETEKSDYQAFVTIALTHNGTMYVDAVLDRLDAFRMVDAGIAISRATRADVFGIEDVAFQKILQPIFIERSTRKGFAVPLLGISSAKEKVIRIRAALTAYLATRQFRFRRGSPGVSLLIEQLKQFPNHKHDDGPDSLAMAVKLAEHMFALGIDGFSVGPTRGHNSIRI